MTFLGHAGMYVETEGGTRPVRPVVQPRRTSARGSRFPATTASTRPGSRRPDYLYISHLHHDHFDPEWLAEHVDQAAEGAAPGVRAGPPRAGAARASASPSSSHTEHAKPVQLGALEVAILAMTAPADGPAGDSALVLADWSARAPQPERRPAPRPARARGARPVRRPLHAVLGRDLVPDGLRLPGRREARARRSASGPTRWSGRCTTSAACARPHIFPIAGPPCFLDDDLFAFNDLDGDPANIFPDQTVFLDELERARASPAASCSCPGTVATLARR